MKTYSSASNARRAAQHALGRLGLEAKAIEPREVEGGHTAVVTLMLADPFSARGLVVSSPASAAPGSRPCGSPGAARARRRRGARR